MPLRNSITAMRSQPCQATSVLWHRLAVFASLAAIHRTRSPNTNTPSPSFPDPSFVAALGDLDKYVGRNEDAEKNYKLFEVISNLGIYSRQQALFYADHDIKLQQAHSIAAKEYLVRKDIYGADALAWTALKAGKLNEAQAAIQQALRLGTQDAKLFYHAGEIAKAASTELAALDYFKRASALNPEFDPLQAARMRKTYSN